MRWLAWLFGASRWTFLLGHGHRHHNFVLAIVLFSCQLEQNNVPPYLLRDNPRAGKVEKKIDGKCGKCVRSPFEATEKSARFNPDFLSVLGVCQDVKSILSRNRRQIDV